MSRRFWIGGGASTKPLKEVGETTYAGTDTWSSTPPSGASTKSYRYTQIGKTVTLWVNLIYATAGTTNGTVTLTWPSGVPAPAAVTGISNASEYLIMGVGGISATLANNGVIGYTKIKNNAANNAYELVIISSSTVSAKVAYLFISFQTT